MTRNIRPLTHLLAEDALLTALAYGSFALYCAGLLSLLPFGACILLYVMRVFNLRHERAHLPLNNLHRSFRALSEFLEVYHTPYQEPFSEKRRKHLLHHQAHAGDGHRKVEGNDHGYLENSLPVSLASAFFYHELMFVLELKRYGLRPERARTLAISSSAILLTILIAGLANFAVFFAAFRFASFVTWFSFSYLLHTHEFYDVEWGSRMPRTLKRGLELVLGSGAVTAIFYHRFHHRRPNQFFVFSPAKA